MSDDSSYKFYLADTLPLLKERAFEAKAERGVSAFNEGRALAYYEVLSTLTHQAEAFGLALDEISLADFDPERDLLGMDRPS